jgi:hypothetical protein
MPKAGMISAFASDSSVQLMLRASAKRLSAAGLSCVTSATL